jgi:DNA-binding FadR family transcriptional regulator
MKKAYEDVAEVLLQQILHGGRANGERLPSEIELADEFGVSRATVREALRAIAARGVIRTSKGMGGGSYVQLPTVQHIAGSLATSLDLLSSAEFLSASELFEARLLIEVPAAQLAAQRRTEIDIERLNASIADASAEIDSNIEFENNADFHETILDACGNTMLAIAGRPVFTVLRDGFLRSSLGDEYFETVREHHHEIARAIERGSSQSAGGLMHEHLEYLMPNYEMLPHNARARLAAAH